MTKKKKCLGFIYNAKITTHLKNVLSNNIHNINNIASCFEEIYILNLNNFNWFTKKKHGFEKIFRDFSFNKKIKFYNPKNSVELDSFFKDKDFHGIITLGKTVNELPIHLLLKKHNVKFFQISNFGNKQIGELPSKKSFLRGYFNIIWRVFMHKLFIILKVFGVIPKIEIRFTSNKIWTNLSKKKQSIYNKIIRFFKISYAKKVIIINSRAYDLLNKNKFIKNEKYIILLDEMFNNEQYLRLGTYTDKKIIKIHYENLIKKLKIISKYYKKKVIICIHPSDNLKEKKNIFSDFIVKQYQTKKYVYQSKLVLFFESSAIIDAIILKKKIMTILSNALDTNQTANNMHYVNEIDIPFLNVDEDLTFDKDTINKYKYDKKKINKSYNSYINKYIAPDNSNIQGYVKISNIIKKNFFLRK
tara:strand:- start:4988 stop:6235 length:1248 start_codon:yes stop_codon:yes gene_type:complete